MPVARTREEIETLEELYALQDEEFQRGVIEAEAETDALQTAGDR